MATPLSVQDLFQLNDDAVKQTVVSTFLEQLKASPAVASVVSARMPVAPVDATFVDNVAVALVCSALARTSAHGFAQTIDLGKSDSYWQSQIDSENGVREGQSLYKWAFPQYCRSSEHTFGEYLKDGKTWGKSLSEHVTTNNFINVEVAKLIASQPDWLAKLNLVFYKLHLLDMSLVDGVVSAWAKAFPDKGIIQNWQTYKFVPKASFNGEMFLGEVNNAISKSQESSYTSPPTTRSGGVTTITTIWGQAVADFLKAGRPAALGIATGKSPNNIDVSTPACCLAGTPVLLLGGNSVPIEQVKQGDAVLAQGGRISVRSDQPVSIKTESAAFIYGFNEYAPFFTAGHVFWTTDGWKAIDDAHANEDNPTLQATQLKVGDVLYQVASVEPFRYREVKIERFTERPVPEGTEFFDLHLEGRRSYHVHGFCVAMNYPMITTARLVAGLQRLTDAERRLLSRSLHPVVAHLNKSIGGFMEEALKPGLAGPEE